MNERALFGAMFAAGVVTAVVAGLAGWHLGRSRTAPPAAIASTPVPSEGRAIVTSEAAAPSSDAPLARPAVPQRAADEAAALSPPVIDSPARPAPEAASPAPAPSLAASRRSHAERPPPAPVREMRSDTPPPARRPDPQGQPINAARPPVDIAPSLAVATALSTAPRASAPEARLDGSVKDRTAPPAGVPPSAAPRAVEPPVIEVARLAVPIPADADRHLALVLSGLPAPVLRADPVPAAVLALAPSLQAPVQVPFVPTTSHVDLGEVITGAVAATSSTERPAAVERADPMRDRGPKAEPPSPVRTNAPRLVPPTAPRAALPAVPSAAAAPQAAPPVSAAAPLPAGAEATAALPQPAILPLPANPSWVKPGNGARHGAKRRRVAVMDPREAAREHRSRRPRSHFARNRIVMDGAMRRRSPVTVIYGTAPRHEAGPVLIRIHSARNGRIRTTRIPLD